MIEAVKSALPLRAYLAEHGIEGRGKHYRCIGRDHEDLHPSAWLYAGRDGHERFRCGSCGLDVDIIGAAMELHGLDFQGVVKLLAERAGIKLLAPADAKKAEAARREREERRKRLEAFQKWERWQVDYLSSMLRAFRSMQARARSEGDLETSAVLQGEIDTLEYRYEIFCRRDDREKFQIYEEAVGYAGAEI